MSESPAGDIRAAAHEMIDALPENATWDDVMQSVHVRRCIDAGIEDSDLDRVVPVDEVRRRFGLSS